MTTENTIGITPEQEAEMREMLSTYEGQATYNMMRCPRGRTLVNVDQFMKDFKARFGLPLTTRIYATLHCIPAN